jgi:hypothetical protein
MTNQNTPRLLAAAPCKPDTLLTDDLFAPDWAVPYPERYAQRAAGPGDGIVELNPNLDAPPYGGAYAFVAPPPPNATHLVFECEVKLPAGVASGTCALVVWAGSYTPKVVALSGSWQKVSARLAAVPNTDHLVSIVVADHPLIGVTGQHRVLVRNARARYEGGDALVAGTTRMYDVSRAPLLWGAFGDPAFDDRGPQTNAHAFVEFITDADAFAFEGYSSLSQFPAYASWAVFVNDQLVEVPPWAYNRRGIYEVALPGEPGTRVRLYSGVKGDQPTIWGQPSSVVGSHLHKLWLDDAADVQFVSPTEVDVGCVVGASIVNGWFGNRPEDHSWTAYLERDLRPRGVMLVREAYGWRPFHEIGSTPARIAAFIAKLRAAKIPFKWILIDLMVNDYALGELQPAPPVGPGLWDAAQYGAAMSEMLVALRAAFPDTRVIIAGALRRANETTPNGPGSTLPDYRAAAQGAVVAANDPEIVYVPTEDFLEESDLDGDGLHPAPKGQSKLGRRWLETGLLG